MRATTCILVLFALVAGCKRSSESTATADERMQKKLAGVWVNEVKTRKDGKGTGTMKLAPDGTYTSILSLPMREVGLRRLESSGMWRIEGGMLIVTATESNITATDFQGTNA